MWWNDFVKDYFHFSFRDRVAAVVMVLVIGMVFCIPYLVPARRNNHAELLAAMHQVQNNSHSKKIAAGNYIDAEKKTTHSSLFYFDPNAASFEQWLQLGIREKTAQTILKYRSKGGHFRSAKDLQKIYGLRTEEFERIAPYVRIQSSSEAHPYRSAGRFSKEAPSFDGTGQLTEERSYKRSTVAPVRKKIDINRSDTSAWIALPGIGSKLANRIVNFRDRLGGFYAVEQVAETYGLKDSTFQLIRSLLTFSPISLQKININTAGPDELKQHPYIRWQLANAIVNFRNEHGPFHSTADLKQILAITEEVYTKLAPYVTVE